MATRARRPPARSTPPEQRPLWTCPRCGNAFVTKNLSHSCGRWPLESHFEGRPRARALFDRLHAAIESIGPVRVVSSKTRITFMTRVRFVAVTPRRNGLRGHVWLTRRVRSPHFAKVEQYAPHAFVHFFDLREPGQIDAELRGYLRDSYAVGRQEHLAKRRSRAGRP